MTQELTLYGFLVPTLTATVIAGTALLYAALGEILSERVGVLNLGVEGMMMTGAVVGYLAALGTGSPWVGLLASAAGAGALALVHAFLTVTLRANQIVSGLALTIFGTGFSSYLGKPVIGVALKNPFLPSPVPGLSQIPFFGPVLFNHTAPVYLSYILVPVIWYWLFRTRPGLHLRSIGENPGAADAMGLSVFGTRYLYVALGGALSGMAGAYLSLAVAPSWIEGMTGGRGWVAVALVVFSAWNPTRALFGAYLFGGVEALTFRIQAVGSTVSSHVLNTLPYLFTIAVLLIATRYARGRYSAPASLGLPYDRENR